MKNLMIRILVVSLFAALFLSFKQPSWETKDYLSWSEKDCKEVLNTSPWVVKTEFSKSSMLGDSNSRMVNRETGGTVGMQVPFDKKEIKTLLEFRVATAKPIKMAFTRLMLLSDPSNQALKEQVQAMVDRAESKIVFHISFSASPADKTVLKDLTDYFANAKLSDFQGNTYLQTSPDAQVPIVDYWASSPQRPNPVFVFPRTDASGKPFFSGQEEQIELRAVLTPTIKSKLEKYEVRVKVYPQLMKFRDQFEM